MGTKTNPSAFDCYANAEPDEPMFILLARDATTPLIVEAWALARENLINDGVKPETDRAMVAEARQCAKDMRAYRIQREAKLAYRRPPGECRTCDEGRNDSGMPSHTASERCESGKYNHCTCDTCY